MTNSQGTDPSDKQRSKNPKAQLIALVATLMAVPLILIAAFLLVVFLM